MNIMIMNDLFDSVSLDKTSLLLINYATIYWSFKNDVYGEG